MNLMRSSTTVRQNSICEPDELGLPPQFLSLGAAEEDHFSSWVADLESRKRKGKKTFVSLTLTHYYFMRVASWTPLEETRKVAMEKNVHLHIVWCVLGEREREHGSMSKALGCQAAFAWLASILHHYQSFMPQQTFVQWKKNLGFFLLREIYTPAAQKNPEVYFCLFVPFCLKPDWRCIAFPNSKCTRTLLNLQLVGREEEKVFARRRSRVKKSNECVIG